MDVYFKAKQLGIETEFLDWQGHRRVVGKEALAAVLDALPPQPSWQHLPGPIAKNAHDPVLKVTVRGADGCTWSIRRGADDIAAGIVEADAIWIDAHLSVGTYRLILKKDGGDVESVPLIVAPEQAWQGSGFDRIWLLTVQLYSVASPRNWGIGDFSDLMTLIDLAAAKGCDGIGLNPLHVLFDDRPDDCSPYAPNSRLFLNPLYVDPAVIPELPNDWIGRHRNDIEAARAGDIIDYKKVANLKMLGLRAAFEAFRQGASPERRNAFSCFQNQLGSALKRFACFEVLRKTFKSAWWEWPDEWRNPNDAKIDDFATGEAEEEVAFVAFLQWCAETQLQACVDHARKSGMKLGLYLDVAVGVQSGGFDAWHEQGAISRQLSVGAPPDQLNTAGQDWGLAGFNSAGLQDRDFEPFRAMLRASLKFSGAVRLDHVLGLNRLYLVPTGFSPRDGVYVDMPLEALLAVIADESVSEQCMVIGEDLGTVPDGFRDRLAARGILSYKVMMFERGHDGAFISGDNYSRNSLVTFNTHDLSSYAGWRSGHDLRIKRSIGIDPGETDEERARAHGALDRRLVEDGIDSSDLFGVTEFLARSSSRILALAVEDLLAVEDQPNIPGTMNEHPNWRRRLPVSIESWGGAIDWKKLSYALGVRG